MFVTNFSGTLIKYVSNGILIASQEKKTSVAPKGRPFIMFELPELYGTRDYLFPISQDDIQICKEECKYIEYPCDEDVYDLCKIIIEEKCFSLQNDPFECVELYLALREEINRLL
ncbi:hypothetical protein JTB14_001110 [Gonioctena quinquepunctata]|nr:hypothetical protein JTB14_001110 [Gonioctena quinquepunctata]